MTRLLLQLSLLPILGFAIILLLIRAQPYDDDTLRAFLLPDDCPAPCLMGIHLNEMTAAEAVQILQNNDWVKSIDRTAINEKTGHGTIYWTWSGKQPVFIDSTLPGMFYSSSVIFQNVDGSWGSDQILGSISIKTRIPYGEVYLLLGGGSTEESWPTNVRGYVKKIISAYYPDKSLVMSAMMDCPATEGKYWNTLVTLNMGFSMNSSGLLLCPTY
jgi:hypothetical protein